MPAIDDLMKRLGFVKLSSYGLVLTPEGRVMSLRPAVLDDGAGGRIVGWQDDDLSAMELQPWEPARPAPARAVATRVATAPVPATPQVVRPIAAPARPVPAATVAVAAEPELDEDDWEWMVAIARARAVDEKTSPVPRVASPAKAPKFVAARTQPMATVAPPRDVRDAMSSGEWPKTEPLGELDYNDYTSPTNEVVRVARIAEQPKAAPRVAVASRPVAPAPTPVVASSQPSVVVSSQPVAPRAATPAMPMPVVSSKPAGSTVPVSSKPAGSTVPVASKPVASKPVSQRAVAPTPAMPMPVVASKPAAPTPAILVVSAKPVAPTPAVSPTFTAVPPPIASHPAATPASPVPVVPPTMRTQPRAASPATIIPVPKLPSIDAARAAAVRPVVKTGAHPIVRPVVPPTIPAVVRPVAPTPSPLPTPIPPAPPRRLAKGTAPIVPAGPSAPSPHIDDTVPYLPLDERTTPHLTLPPVAARAALPSIRTRLGQ
ncbi:MAG: hypothetical protein ACTHU0_14880 [Kofleriaceae bacterium]